MADLTDDERTDPLGLFNTARSYWRSAEHLNAAQLKVTHPHAPVTFLYCHAIELYLKAYLRAAGSSVFDLKKIGHRVARLAEAAAAAGLKLSAEDAGVLSHVDDADVAIEARYIVTGFKRQPTTDALASVAQHVDPEIAAALKSKGHHIRDEQFQRPEPQPSGELGEVETRVLRLLFAADDREHRNDAVMARVLGMQRNALKYHLDRLKEAKLVQTEGANARHQYLYWGLTPEGRRYVVERKP